MRKKQQGLPAAQKALLLSLLAEFPNAEEPGSCVEWVSLDGHELVNAERLEAKGLITLLDDHNAKLTLAAFNFKRDLAQHTKDAA